MAVQNLNINKKKFFSKKYDFVWMSRYWYLSVPSLVRLLYVDLVLQGEGVKKMFTRWGFKFLGVFHDIHNVSLNQKHCYIQFFLHYFTYFRRFYTQTTSRQKSFHFIWFFDWRIPDKYSEKCLQKLTDLVIIFRRGNFRWKSLTVRSNVVIWQPWHQFVSKFEKTSLFFLKGRLNTDTSPEIFLKTDLKERWKESTGPSAIIIPLAWCFPFFDLSHRFLKKWVERYSHYLSRPYGSRGDTPSVISFLLKGTIKYCLKKKSIWLLVIRVSYNFILQLRCGDSDTSTYKNEVRLRCAAKSLLLRSINATTIT